MIVTFKPFKVLKKLTERGQNFSLFFFVHISTNLNTERYTPIGYNIEYVI
jgi:hypothetical protein